MNTDKHRYEFDLNRASAGVPTRHARGAPQPLWLGLLVVSLASAQESGANLPARPLAAGDLTAVVVYGAPELSRTVRVSAEGTIHLPMLERRIDVAGMMPLEVEEHIAAALVSEQILRNPAVTVTIAEYHSRPISVVGAVRQPVTFPAYSRTTLL